MRFNWNEKVVLITGSSGGIGWQLAQILAIKGACIVLNGRNKDRLKEKEKQLHVLGYKVSSFCADIATTENCTALIRHCESTFGKLDVLINNAALSAQGMAIDQLSPAVFTQLAQVNFLGSVYMTHAALPLLKQTKGSILFISSVAAIHGLGNYAAYSSTKMALTAFAQSLQKELSTTGVHCGIAYVSFTENDVTKTILNADGVIIPQTIRSKIKTTAQSIVAARLIRMIEKRNSSAVFSGIGKLLNVLNRLSPRFVHYLLLYLYRKENNIS